MDLIRNFMLIILLSSCIVSCKEKCNNSFYIRKFYLYPNNKVNIIINDSLYFNDYIRDLVTPKMYKTDSRFINDICLDSSIILNFKISIDNKDSVFALNSKYIEGCYIGLDGDNKIAVIIDSLGNNFYYWNNKITGQE